MIKRWDYRCEFTGLERYANGAYQYHTQEEGKIPYTKPFEASGLKLEALARGVDEMLRTGNDVVVYVTGKHIVSRTRTVCSAP